MKKIISWLLTLALSATVCAAAAVPGAALTDFDGYELIYDYKDLKRVNNDLNGKYKLMRDIDMSAVTSSGTWSENAGGWSYIGSESEPFTGEFDGNGYEIKNLNIRVNYTEDPKETKYAGLFGINKGTVKNLKIVGTLSGGYVDAKTYVGSVCGYNDGLLEGCGHVGVVNFNNIADKYPAYIGGIAGKNSENGVIRECYQAGDVSAEDEDIQDLSVNCEPLYCGGITTGGGTFEHCYISGRVIGSFLDGANPNTPLYHTFCYRDKNRKTSYVQCYCVYDKGNNFYIFDNGASQTLPKEQMKRLSSYYNWDFENIWLLDDQCEYPYPQLRKCPQINGAVHREQEQLPSGEFIEVYDLADLVYADTNPDKNYRLMNDIDIAKEMEQGKVEWYKKGSTWRPLGLAQKRAFTGVFDGNGHTVSNLNYGVSTGTKSKQNLGLFYQNDGVIKNLKLTGRVELRMLGGSAPSAVFGAIALTNNGTIEGCSSDINAYSESCTYFDESNSIIDDGRYAYGGFTASGIAAANYGIIKRCYTMGNMTIIVKDNYKSYFEEIPWETKPIFTGAPYYFSTSFYAISSGGTVENCYNFGTAPNFIGSTFNGVPTKIIHCYNVDTVGSGECFVQEWQEDGSVEKRVLSKEEMQQQSSFPGFDFENIWYFDPSDEYCYPKLRGVTKDLPIPVITKIKVTSLPDRITFFEGEELDATGLAVTAVYDNGNTKAVTDYTLSGYDSTIGKKTVTVHYSGFTESFEVDVVEDPLKITGISVIVPPAKTEYYQNEKLDTTGMVVAAATKNGEIRKLEDYTVSEINGNVGEQTVTVSYRAFKASFKINVLEGNAPVKKGDFNGDGKINGADAGMFSRYVSGWYGSGSSVGDLSAMDINGDGKVNGADAGILSRYASGWAGYEKYFQ